MFFSWFIRNEKQIVSDDISQVYIELSTFCNLSCKTCIRNSIHNFKPVNFSKGLMKKVSASLKRIKTLNRIVLMGFGEAFVNPRIKELLKDICSLEIPVVLVTNGNLLGRELVKFISQLPIQEIYFSWDDPVSKIDSNAETRIGSDIQSLTNAIEYLKKIKIDEKKNYPGIGLEIVATKRNIFSIRDIIRYWHEIGVEKFIITNLFPYSGEMKDDILYSINKNDKNFNLTRLIDRDKKKAIKIANQTAETNRSCPFIEKGTMFISATGDVAPCPELAYTHKCFYFGSQRTHYAYIIGNIKKQSLNTLWSDNDFVRFRETFHYYEYPDCTTCFEPDMCWHRTVDVRDCYENPTPCGECLWAKNIVICP